MSTGFDSFADSASLEALYPFIGFEWVLVVAVVVSWARWMIKQSADETEGYQKASDLIREVALEEVMAHGGRAGVRFNHDVPDIRAETEYT